MDTIVITGTSTKQKILDTSFAVSVINQEDLANSPAVGTAALLSKVPGLYAEASGGDSNTNMSARGLKGGFFNYISLQEDGLPNSYNGFLSEFEFRRDLSYDRVEVTRGGPSGVLTANGPAAIVNFISREAPPTPGGEVALSTTSYGQTRFDGFYGGPITENLSGTVGGFYHKGEGQKHTGFDADDGGQLRAGLEYKFDRGSVSVNYKFIDISTAFFTPQPVKYVPDGKFQTFGQIPGFDSGSDYLAGPGERITYMHSPTGRGPTLDLSDGERTLTNQITFKGDFELGANFKVSDQLRFAHMDERSTDLRNLGGSETIYSASDFLADKAPMVSPYSPTGRLLASDVLGAFASQGAVGVRLFDALTGQPIANPAGLNGNGMLIEQGVNFYDQKIKQTINKFEIAHETDRNTLTLGLLTFDISAHINQITTTYLLGIANNAHPIDVAAVNAAGKPVGYLTDHGVLQYGGSYFKGDMDVKSNSVYLNDQLQVTDKLRIDAGIRREFYEFSGTGDVPNARPELAGGFLPDGTPATNVLADRYGGSFGTGTYTGGSYSNQATSWTIGGNYEFNKSLAVYGRWADSIDTDAAFPYQFAPACAGFVSACLAVDNPPTNLKFGELGVRVSQSNFYTSLTGFYSINKNLGQATNNTGQVVKYDYNAYGLEFDASWRPLEQLKFDLSGVLQKSSVSTTSGTIALSGKQLDRLPLTQLHLTTDYTFNEGRGTVELGLNHYGVRYGDFANTFRFPAYTSVDVGISYKMTPDILASVQVTNLTNDDAATEGNSRSSSAIQLGTSPYGYVRSILPRAALFRISTKF